MPHLTGARARRLGLVLLSVTALWACSDELLGPDGGTAPPDIPEKVHEPSMSVIATGTMYIPPENTEGTAIVGWTDIANVPQYSFVRVTVRSR